MTRCKLSRFIAFFYCFFFSLFQTMPTCWAGDQVDFQVAQRKVIVVTGATGHVGISFIENLLENSDFQIRALYLDQEQRLVNLAAKLEKKGVEFKTRLTLHQVDILSENELVAVLNDAHAIVHLAAVISIQSDDASIEKMRKVNIEGTRNLLKAAKEAGVQRFIHCSSTHAYVHHPDRALSTKNGLVDTSMPNYDATKAYSQKALQEFARENPSFKYVIIAPSGIIGRNDHEDTEMWPLFSGYLITRLGPIPDGSYAFVDIRQVCDLMSAALIKLLDESEFGSIHGQEFLIHGQVFSISQLVTAMQKVTGYSHCLNHLWYGTPLCLPLSFFAALAPFHAFFAKKPLVTEYSLAVLSSLPHGVDQAEEVKLEQYFGPAMKKYTLEETVQDRYDVLAEHSNQSMICSHFNHSQYVALVLAPILLYTAFRLLY